MGLKEVENMYTLCLLKPEFIIKYQSPKKTPGLDIFSGKMIKHLR